MIILGYVEPHRPGDIVRGVHAPTGDHDKDQPAYIVRESSIEEWRRVNIEEYGWSVEFARRQEDLCRLMRYVYFYEVSVD